MIVPGPTAGPSGATRRALSSLGVIKAGFLAAGLLVAAAVLLVALQQGDDARLRHSLAIEVAVSDVLSTLQDAQIGQRGFLLTNDPDFLEPYRKASERLTGELEHLGQLVIDQPEQLRLFRDLRALAAAAHKTLDDTLTAHARGDVQGALDLVKARTIRGLMEEIRQRVGAMDAEEDRHVAERQSKLRTTRLFAAASIIGLICVMGVLAHAALREAERRAALARFVPSEIAPDLADGARVLSNGAFQDAAVAIVDLRDSTALAEKLPPVAFLQVLSEFRRQVTDAARATSGMIEKFMGDGALVVFGLTGRTEEAAADALQFAENLVRLTQGTASSESRQGMGSLSLGIGVHHGPVFCGVLGDDDRLEFTVIGDAVNVASRLEAQTKAHGVALIASEVVLRAAGASPEEWQSIASDTLPGRQGPVRMYAKHPTCPAETDLGPDRPASGMDLLDSWLSHPEGRPPNWSTARVPPFSTGPVRLARIWREAEDESEARRPGGLA